MAPYVICGGFVVLDILTGLIKALYKGDVNSSILRKGLYRKLSEFLVIFAIMGATYACLYTGYPAPYTVFKGILAYICLMESVSALENIGEVNPALANILRPYLEKLKKNK